MLERYCRKSKSAGGYTKIGVHKIDIAGGYIFRDIRGTQKCPGGTQNRGILTDFGLGVHKIGVFLQFGEGYTKRVI